MRYKTNYVEGECFDCRYGSCNNIFQDYTCKDFAHNFCQPCFPNSNCLNNCGCINFQIPCSIIYLYTGFLLGNSLNKNC